MIEQFKIYEARICVRPEFNGCPARPEALALNGQVVRLMAQRMQDGKYTGEWEMIREDGDWLVKGKWLDNERYQMGVPWIASGDLADIKEVADSEEKP